MGTVQVSYVDCTRGVFFWEPKNPKGHQHGSYQDCYLDVFGDTYSEFSDTR